MTLSIKLKILTLRRVKLLFPVLLFGFIFSGCSGEFHDPAALKASKGTGPDGKNENGATPQNPGESIAPGNPGVDPGNGSGIGNGGGSGNGSGLPAAAPQIEIQNINSEYLRGGVTQDIIFRVTSRVGAVSKLEYVVKCPTSSSVPEFSITTGSAPNTPSAVTIQNNVVSVGLGEDTIAAWATPNLADVRCKKTNGTFEQAVNNFKIRITSTGEANLSTSVESSEFQIDSDAPVFAAAGLACHSGGCTQGGFGRVQITGVSDTVTPVSQICLKFDDTTAPAPSDLCWRPLTAMGVNPPSNSPATFIFDTFVSYLPFDASLYFWVQDAAGNVSTLSNSGLGTNNRDKLDFSVMGTAKIAGGDTTFFTTSQGLFHDSSAGEAFRFNVAPLGAVKKYAESDPNFSNFIADLNSVTHDGVGRIFVKDASKGILKIDTLNIDGNPSGNIKSVLIPQTGTFNEGDIGTGAPSFKKVNRYAIDAKGYHWFIDDGKLAFIDMDAAVPTLVHVAGGGTDETSDDFTNPKLLKINSNDNIDAYGVFAVLPNQWVVFSADDPALPLNPASGPRFKLRIYKHNNVASERRISTIYLNGSTAQGPTDNLVPYSSLAISYDKLRSNIGNITGRFCSTSIDLSLVEHCDSAKLIQFYISTNSSPVYLGSVAKDSFMSFQYLDSTLYMMDNTRGTVSKFDSGSFQKLVGATARGSGYCQNMSVSSSCGLRLVDFKVLPTGNDQILILDENYLRIVEQGQVFSIYSGAL